MWWSVCIPVSFFFDSQGIDRDMYIIPEKKITNSLRLWAKILIDGEGEKGTEEKGIEGT